MSLSTGARLGPYEIISPLGTGGTGEVFRARDTRLGRTVALKILPEGLSSDAGRHALDGRSAKRWWVDLRPVSLNPWLRHA